MNSNRHQFSAPAMSSFVARLGLLMGGFGYTQSDVNASMVAVHSVLARGGPDALILVGELFQRSGLASR